MVLQTIKFSQFINGGDLENGEKTAGLFSADNALFNNPWTFLAPGTTASRPVIAPIIYYRLRLNTTIQQYEYYDPILAMWVQLAISSTTFIWQSVTTSPTTLSPNHGYVVNYLAGTEVFTLPPVSAFGDEIAITGNSSGGWQINQTIGQSINFGFYSTTVGVGGGLFSNHTADSLRMVCIAPNLTWNVISSIGNITIV